MSREITLRLNDLDGSGEASNDLPETIVKILEGLDGVLAVGYDAESRRFTVSYDAKEVTVLRILSRIEFPDEQTSRGYRPTDVQASDGGLVPFTHSSAGCLPEHAESARFSSSSVTGVAPR